jgi:hypothetical protein
LGWMSLQNNKDTFKGNILTQTQWEIDVPSGPTLDQSITHNLLCKVNFFPAKISSSKIKKKNLAGKIFTLQMNEVQSIFKWEDFFTLLDFNPMKLFQKVWQVWKQFGCSTTSWVQYCIPKCFPIWKPQLRMNWSDVELDVRCSSNKVR